MYIINKHLQTCIIYKEHSYKKTVYKTFDSNCGSDVQIKIISGYNNNFFTVNNYCTVVMVLYKNIIEMKYNNTKNAQYT